MPFTIAGDESTTASCRTPRKTGRHVAEPHPCAAYPKRNGGLSPPAARDAIMTKPPLTAGVVVTPPPPGVARQIGSHDPPGPLPQPAASKNPSPPSAWVPSDPPSAT